MKGTKLEEQVQNFNENMRNYETKCFFSFAKQLETLYFVFREMIETRQIFLTVLYFAKLKKNETVDPTSQVSCCSTRPNEDVLTTPYGTVHVAKRGNPRGPALITCHDLGLNHISNFQVTSSIIPHKCVRMVFE